MQKGSVLCPFFTVVAVAVVIVLAASRTSQQAS
jgi:hypothetical protein